MNFKLFSGRLDIELTRRDGLRLWVRNADFDGSEFHMQIARPHSAIAGCVTVGSMSGDVSGHVALWPVGLYWHATHPTLRDAARVLVDDYKGREVSLRIGGSDCVDRVIAHWRVWSPPHEWTRGTPRWRDGSWYPLATLFGPTTYRYRRVPAIERLPAPTKLPKREQIREGYMSETGYLRLCVPVSRAADLKVGQASAIISGAGVVLSQVSLTRFLDARTYVCDLQAYLSHTARVTIEPYTIRTVRESDGSVRERKSSSVGYLLAMLGRAYRSIYRDHEAWGVWGHEISDLVFESLSIRDNIVTVGIGS